MKTPSQQLKESLEEYELYMDEHKCYDSNARELSKQFFATHTKKLLEAEKEREEYIKPDLRLILDFVERWNKQDKESNVSEAAERLQQWADDIKSFIKGTMGIHLHNIFCLTQPTSQVRRTSRHEPPGPPTT